MLARSKEKIIDGVHRPLQITSQQPWTFFTLSSTIYIYILDLWVYQEWRKLGVYVHYRFPFSGRTNACPACNRVLDRNTEGSRRRRAGGTSGERILKRCSRTRAQGAAFTELSRSGGKHRAESFNTRTGTLAVSRRVSLKRARIFNKADFLKKHGVGTRRF